MFRRSIAVVLGPVLAVTILVVPAAAASTVDTGNDAGRTRATIRYTEHGIPHILAGNFSDLGYGYGYSIAKDDLCELADTFLTVRGERSRYHGPGGSGNTTLSSASSNLNSDLHFARINDSGVVERIAATPAPKGPRQEVREIVAGYVQGYNRYLDTIGGPGGIKDPSCHGAPWVRHITESDVYRIVYALMTLQSRGALADDLITGEPGAMAAPPAPAATTSARLKAGLDRVLGTGEKGSNGIAIGSDGTAEGHSVLLGNPHFPWRGANLFWQAQLTVPGRLNVSGAGLLGIPVFQKGYNAQVAWTHSLATPRMFGLYELRLAPGDPTSYLVDGVREKMTKRTVRVTVKQADGSQSEVAKTFYDTRYGPMLTSAAGVDLPWTTESGYTMRDAAAGNLRGLNTWFGFGTARSTADIKRVLTSTQGAPWVNTMATDRAGNALYADIQPVPHITGELVGRCSTPLGERLFPESGTSVLDGSASSCAWGSDPDSIEPGLLSPKRLPSLSRKDYVLNSNDSPWLPNPHAPITGFPRIVGEVGTPLSMRTRESITSVEEALRDGGFGKESMKRMLFTARSRYAVLAADDTARMCAAFPGGKAPSSDGPVDVRRACRALATWDHTFSLRSRGSLLFERFVLKLEALGGAQWRTPFDPAAPVSTPNTLNTANPGVRRAFGDAAAELRGAGIPLDAELGDYQSVTLDNGERIPLRGGAWAAGVLDVVEPVWDPRHGNVDVRTGSSYIQVVSFGAGPCPDADTLLTYSQSQDPTSPYFSDQTKMYSEGKWVRGRFCEKDILDSPKLRVVTLS